MTRITYYAAAKINLNLDVLSRRPDGYHEIFTTFQAIDIYDTLTFEKAESGGIQIVCATPEFPKGSENLISRALAGVGRYTSAPINVCVTVEKGIPMAAGLGGGSSDAAAAIRAAVALYDFSLTENELRDWAAMIGADVPFFLGSAQAEGRGRGDLITPIEFYSDYWLVLVKPAAELSTAAVYAALDLALTKKDLGVSFASCRDREEFFSILIRAQNALTATVIRKCPEAGRALRFLEEQGPVAARITGSGPCVFGIFREKPDLGELTRRCPSSEWRMDVCRPLVGRAAAHVAQRSGASRSSIGRERTDRQGAGRGDHRSAHHLAE